MNAKHLAILNVLMFLASAIYSITCIPSCTAYFMHDASIDTGPTLLITIGGIFLMAPALVQWGCIRRGMPIPAKLHTIHFAISVVCIALLALAVTGPCNFINGGHYMFIGSGPFILSYSLRVIGFGTLIPILYVFGKDVLKSRKNAG